MTRATILQDEKKIFTSFLNFIPILMILGFPRIYNTEIPMAILLLPFYWRPVIAFIKSNQVHIVGFLIILTFWFFLGITSFLIGNGDLTDVLFHFQLLIKILMNAIFGVILYSIIKKNSTSLLIWLYFQFTLIIISSFHKQTYMYLLSFISRGSADVFKEIYGLRTVGFGLIHVDGAITIVSACYLLLLINNKKILSFLMWLIVLPLSMTLARSSVIAYSIYSIFPSKKIIRYVFFTAVVLMFLLGLLATSGPLYEAAEIFRNFILLGDLTSTSVRGTANMYILPKTFFTWLVGDGRYFGDLSTGLSFYMKTDAGYLRMIFFSGILYLFTFIIINLYFIFFVFLFKEKKSISYLKFFAFALTAVFVILNAKGIQTISVFSTLIYCLAKDIERNQI